MGTILTCLHKPGTRRKRRRVQGTRKYQEKRVQFREMVSRDRERRKRESDTKGPKGAANWDLDYD